MSGLSNTPRPAGWCPFCGVATEVPHESQEGCIAALQEEIGRVRGVLAHLTPTGSGGDRSAKEENPSPVHIRLTKN